MTTPIPAQEPVARPRRGAGLPRHVYPLRILGLGTGFIAVAAVFREQGAHPLAWAGLAFNAFIWPHVAYLLARRNADPWRAERRNLILDSAFCGLWLPLMSFNLLPSVLLVSMMSLDKISVGGPRLLFVGWGATLAGAAIAMLAAAPVARLETSFGILLACIPLLVLYPLSIGIAAYRLRVHIRKKNLVLARLLRTEPLSGLATRQHWEEEIARELERCRRTGERAGLVLLDLDGFKGINDRFGHLAGDEVLRQTGEILRRVLRPADVACRYGGDEFGVLVPVAGMAGARLAAERVREAIETLRVTAHAEVRVTASLGVAEIGPQTANVREAVEQADHALYCAKNTGHNRVETYVLP